MDACLRLVDAFPRLLVVPHVLEGLRAVRAAGGLRRRLADARRCSRAVAPALGVNALTQAAVEHALRIGDAEIDRRRRSWSSSASALPSALHDLPVDATDSQANFVWLRAPGLSGAALAQRARARRA